MLPGQHLASRVRLPLELLVWPADSVAVELFVEYSGSDPAKSSRIALYSQDMSAWT